MNKHKNSLRLLIIISFILLIIMTFSIIGFYIFFSWKESAHQMVAKIQNNTNTNILRQIERLIDIPLNINKATYMPIQSKIVDIDNDDERDVFFSSVIESSSEEVYSFSYGTENGEYYGARRNVDNRSEIIRNNEQTNGKSRYYSTSKDLRAEDIVTETGKFDVRTRVWYKIAKEKKEPVFSPIYKHFVMDDLAISAAYPIYHKDVFLGVIGTHITLSKINHYLKELTKDNVATAYIIEKNSGYFVANSRGIPNFEMVQENEIKRTSVNEVDERFIIEAYNNYLQSSNNTFVIKKTNDNYHVQLTEYKKEGLDWLIITAIPESPFMAKINRSIQISILISIIAIVVAILLYMKSTKVIFRPIDILISTTERFSEGDFSKRADVFRNDEIGKLAMAFNNMADQLNHLIGTLEEKVATRTSELEKVNGELKNSEENIRLILDSTAEAIYGIDLDGNCIFCNASCLKILKYKEQDELIGKNMHNLIHHKSIDGSPLTQKECKIYRAISKGEGTHVDNEVFWRADGTSFLAEYYAYPQCRDGKVVGAVVTFMDITERKKSEEEILYLSYHDQLTGLYNRRYFEQELRRLDNEHFLPLTIIMGDMNGLKLINDSLGHSVGDQLLKKAADVLTNGFRVNDIIARIGGDEFVIILPRTSSDEANELIKKIKNRTAKEKVGAVSVSISFGYETKYSQDENIGDILKKAEEVMYKAKLFESPSMRGKTINAIISTLHEKSPREEAHSRIVSDLCQQIGEALGLSEDDIKELKVVGLLHDIGKIAIEESTLSKPEKLTDVEWEEVKRHPEIGYRILSTVNETSAMAEYVLAHHERWDGKGYPKGLRQTEIPLQSRIIAIADAYEAMTSGRNHKNAISQKEVIVELTDNAGTQFDPVLVKVFIEKVLGDGEKELM